MSVAQLPSGRWRVKAGGTYLRGTYATEGEARGVDAALREMASEPTTFRAHASAWVDRRELAGMASAARTDRSRLATVLASAPWADWPVETVGRREVRRWLEAYGRGRATQTVRNALNLVRGAFAAALEDELCDENPARDVRVPRERRTDDPWTFARPAEVAALLEVVDEWSVVAFAVGTGLRAGEQAALRWEDVHGDHIVVRFGGIGRPTKGGKPRRVPLFGLAREALTRWTRVPNDRGLVFPTPRGEPRTVGHMLGRVGRERSDRFGALASGALGRPFRWHDLRHTCATHLLCGWWGRPWTLAEVASLLGHASVGVTQRYAHVVGSAAEAAARDMPGSFVAPPTGIEPVANGLGRPRPLESDQAVVGGSALLVALAAGDGAAALAMLEHVVREARAGRWGAAVELVSQSNAKEEGGARVG